MGLALLHTKINAIGNCHLETWHEQSLSNFRRFSQEHSCAGCCKIHLKLWSSRIIILPFLCYCFYLCSFLSQLQHHWMTTFSRKTPTTGLNVNCTFTISIIWHNNFMLHICYVTEFGQASSLCWLCFVLLIDWESWEKVATQKFSVRVVNTRSSRIQFKTLS